MMNRQLRQDFERDGFVAIPGFCAPQQCADLNRILDAHYAPAAYRQQEENAFNRHFACDVVPWDPVSEGNNAFINLRADEALRTITTACIGPGYTEASSLVMYSCSGGRGQSWHQDCPVNHRGHFNVNRLLYTRDVEKDDGAVVVVPGSHRQGRIPDGGHHETMEGEQLLCPRAGTLILLHGWCFHRVLPNTSKRPRISINFRCYPLGTPADVCSVGVYRNGEAYFKEARVALNDH